MRYGFFTPKFIFIGIRGYKAPVNVNTRNFFTKYIRYMRRIP